MSTALDDERVVRALRSYQEALESGGAPDRGELLARFPEFADELAGVLDGLHLVHQVAPELKDEARWDHEARPWEPIGDFRILREVGRGGMGVVYEAEQMSLGRRVALKVLPFAAILDPRYLQRFRNEAQAAAHLHHAHIVPVYAVGSDRGVHYYAMQFVEGPTVAGLIDELRSLPESGEESAPSPALAAITGERTNETRRYCRAIANLGIQAADALDYAHESGVVHRDVKPANLMVDATGHLWITDFGLASTQRDGGLTMTGDMVGTLRYMSPEQARAGRAPVDHRTDVYSLGATLYELLTLQPAFPGDEPHAVLRDIATREPPRPRALNPAVPAELETITLKAMSKDPGDRYATAGDLADDLRRFLDHRPIVARRPSLPKRVVQWAHRHTPVLWAAGAVLVLGVAALAISTVLIDKERDRALAGWHRADIEKERAQAGFQMSSGVVDRLLDVMATGLPQVPNLELVQRTLLEEALVACRAFVDEAAGDPGAQSELAAAYARLGSVHGLLGSFPDAREDYSRAIRLYRSLVADGDPEHRAGLARTLVQLAQLLNVMHEDDEAFRRYEEAVDVLRQLCAEYPIPGYRLELSLALATGGGEGVAPEPTHHPPFRAGAEAALKEAIEIRKSLSPPLPDEAENQSAMGALYHNLALVHLARGEREEGQRLLEQAIASQRAALKADPGDIEKENYLANHCMSLSDVARNAGELPRARKLRAEAIAIVRDYVRRFPAVPHYRDKLALVVRAQAHVLDEMGEPKASDALFEEAAALYATLARERAPASRHEWDAGVTLGNWARVARRRGELESARTRMRKAIDHFEAAMAIGNYPIVQRTVAWSYRDLGHFWLASGDAEQAAKQYRKALELALPLVETGDDDHARDLVGSIWEALADMGAEEPVAGYGKAAESYESVQEKHRGTLWHLAYVRSERARALWTLDRKGESTPEARKALETYKQVRESGPYERALHVEMLYVLEGLDPALRDPALAAELAGRMVEEDATQADGWEFLGIANYRLGELKEAVESLEKALEIRSPTFSACDHLFLAMANWRLGDREKARELYAKGIAWIAEHAPDHAKLAAVRAEADAVMQ